jgi:prepilin-type N-terminal cleavage/methylation domain-containing protein
VAGPTRVGVTLIELVVALALVALIASLALTQLTVPQKQAQLKADVAQANALAQAVSAFYAVNGCYPDPTSTQTAPFSGSMPANLSPYVGGPWPATQLYGTFDQNWNWVGSGATAYYVGVIPQSVWVGNVRGYVLVVNNQAVRTC